jgi:hypothetical protein
MVFKKARIIDLVASTELGTKDNLGWIGWINHTNQNPQIHHEPSQSPEDQNFAHAYLACHLPLHGKPKTQPSPSWVNTSESGAPSSTRVAFDNLCAKKSG